MRFTHCVYAVCLYNHQTLEKCKGPKAFIVHLKLLYNIQSIRMNEAPKIRAKFFVVDKIIGFIWTFCMLTKVLILSGAKVVHIHSMRYFDFDYIAWKHIKRVPNTHNAQGKYDELRASAFNFVSGIGSMYANAYHTLNHIHISNVVNVQCVSIFWHGCSF